MEPNFECLPYWSKAGCLSEVDMGILPTRLKGGMWIEFSVCMGIRLRKCLGMGNIWLLLFRKLLIFFPKQPDTQREPCGAGSKGMLPGLG